VYRTWVALIDDEDVADMGVQGYLKISIQIVGPGDKMKVGGGGGLGTTGEMYACMTYFPTLLLYCTCHFYSRCMCIAPFVYHQGDSKSHLIKI